MSDKGYWRRRAAEYAAEWENRCKDELEAELKKYFRSSLGEIEKEIEALYGRLVIPGQQNLFAMEEAKRLIRGAEYKKWRKSLAEYLALSHTDSKILKELNVLAMRSRINRLEKLYSETLISLQKLGEKYEGAVQEFLESAYKERYYRGVYDLAKVGKMAIPVAKVEPAKMEKVLASKWQGGNYSSRIWKNTEKLSAEIKKAVAQGVHRGLSVQKLSRNLAREMEVSYKNAERLVRTELNFAQNQAARESLESAGLKEYEFLATLDHRTTPRCQALDGTVHLLEEYMPGSNAPPMHPRCRSTICAVTEGGTRVAKVKGKSIRVPAEMSYDKWRGSLEMYRRKTTDTNYNFVSEEKYSRLIIPLQKMGVTILRGGDIEKHLDAMNAQAANFGKDVVFFREKVTVSAILEETHHVKQNRAGQNDDKDVELRTILNEIDAKEYLLRVVKKYKIPREEIEETKKQLEEYLKALEEYNRKKG